MTTTSFDLLIWLGCFLLLWVTWLALFTDEERRHTYRVLRGRS